MGTVKVRSFHCIKLPPPQGQTGLEGRRSWTWPIPGLPHLFHFLTAHLPGSMGVQTAPREVPYVPKRTQQGRVLSPHLPASSLHVKGGQVQTDGWVLLKEFVKALRGSA